MAGSTTSETRGGGPRNARGDAANATGPQPCSACRASGRVLANRGETQESLPCPWCRGTGTWEPGYDAQTGEQVELAQ